MGKKKKHQGGSVPQRYGYNQTPWTPYVLDPYGRPVPTTQEWVSQERIAKGDQTSWQVEERIWHVKTVSNPTGLGYDSFSAPLPPPQSSQGFWDSALDKLVDWLTGDDRQQRAIDPYGQGYRSRSGLPPGR